MTLYWQFEVGFAKVAKCPIGTGLARIGQDWQIGEFESERKIDPRLAQDWHGLARIGLIGSDWPGLADWRICVQTKNWRRIGIRLAQDWH